ncbi:TetR family transcriptional regulator [Rhodococcus sp. 24CO]|uniref:TetR family transcriptional regulator n=1 Tax=Rhodococcus sp. 24CO TaxID=3117460 RepID=UPI003D3284E9
MTEPINDLRPVGNPVRTRRPRQQRATITKANILEAAARSFAYNGYAATSLADLLAASGTTKGAVYFHFDSKEAIARELVAHWSAALTHAAAVAHDSQSPSVAQISSFFGDLAASIAVSSLARAGLRLTTETGIDGAREAFAQWIDITSSLVDAVIASGQLPDNSTTRQLSWNLCAGFIGTVNIIRVLGDTGDFTARMHSLVTVHLAACTAAESG